MLPEGVPSTSSGRAETATARADNHSRAGPFARGSAAWRHHRYVLPSIAAATLVFAWLVTWGDWAFFAPEPFATFYDAHAAGIVQGRLDVDPGELAGEDFIFEGKHYGYFGPGPALLRIPLRRFFGQADGSWSRPLMTAAFALGLAYAYGFLVLARRAFAPDEDAAAPIPARHKWAYSLFVLTAGLGTSALFMGSRAFVFHEANLLASTFTLACLYHLLAYLGEPRRIGSVLWAGAWGALALQTRATTGAGAELGLLMAGALLTVAAFAAGSTKETSSAVRRAARWFASLAGVAPTVESRAARRRAYALLPAALGAIGIASYLGVNYLKFRTFNGVPVQYYVRYRDDPASAKQVRYQQVHRRNVPTTTAAAYFSPTRIDYAATFPWVFLRTTAPICRKARIGLVEPYASLPAGSPALTLLAAVGFAVLVVTRCPAKRRWRVPAAAALAGGGVVLTTVAVSQHYLHDFYPLLVIAAAFGLHAVLSRFEVVRRAIRLRCAVVGLCAAACVYSVWANVAFALTYQRDIVWGVPGRKKAEFQALRRGIDGMVGTDKGAGQMRLLTTDGGAPPENPVPGQLWLDASRGTARWFNGVEWVSAAPGGDVIHCKGAFRDTSAGRREPLVTSGRVGAADFVLVRHLGDGHSVLAFDHWGLGGPQSGPVEILPGRLYDLSVRLGPANGAASVWFDGRPVIEHPTPVFPVIAGAVSLGENRISDLTEPRLDGTIFPLYERPRGAERTFTANGATGAEAAADRDVRTEWVVPPGGDPTTLTLRCNGPVVAQSLYLVSRAGTGPSSWRRLSMRYFAGDRAAGVQEFILRDPTAGGVQALRIGPVAADRFELTFSEPASDRLGYAEIVVGWE